ncbi:hypothetical protein Palpr_0182 [Paludibacter propionicigenes WB4]|uniref:Uncharacterized protein n=1 Tax=Paludibacter propionicigenes (strain DSM 17365 / JCM 13257 / WB4) TaxID=694427 RepID=E4T0I5_PALPW|nr:hypothetical protein Palpr_0182 [Paludibacter propionicigenes WB4]
MVPDEVIVEMRPERKEAERKNTRTTPEMSKSE